MSQDKTMVIDKPKTSAEQTEVESLTSVSVSTLTADIRDAARKQQATTTPTAEGTPDFLGLEKINLGGIANTVLGGLGKAFVKKSEATVFATPEMRAKQESLEIKNDLSRRQVQTKIESEELRNQQQQIKNELSQGQVGTKLKGEDLKNTQLEQKIVTDYRKTDVDIRGKEIQLTETQQNSDLKQMQTLIADTLKLLKESYAERQKIYSDMIKNAPDAATKYKISEQALKDNEANQQVLMQLATRLSTVGQSVTQPTPAQAASSTSATSTSQAPTAQAPTGSAPTGAAPGEAPVWTPTQPLPSDFSPDDFAPGRVNVPRVPLAVAAGMTASEASTSGRERVGKNFKFDPFAKPKTQQNPNEVQAPRRPVTDENFEQALRFDEE